MAVTIKGVQPLKWGTTTMTGYIVEEFANDFKTEEHLIEDENGDIATQIVGFGLNQDITVSVIPKTAVAQPNPGDLFVYGEPPANTGFRILSIAIKHIRKDVAKWVLKGKLFPNVNEA